jgi:transposase
MSGLRTYSEHLKQKVIHEVQSGILSKEEARRRYGIKGNCTILTWIRKFESQNVKFTTVMARSKKDSKDDLMLRIRELERQLELEKLRSFGYSKMIEIAEQELKISIRKKSDTKQSKS